MRGKLSKIQKSVKQNKCVCVRKERREQFYFPFSLESDKLYIDFHSNTLLSVTVIHNDSDCQVLPKGE